MFPTKDFIHPISVNFPTLYTPLNLSGVFRFSPEDFVVYENLGFTPTGEGEHQLIHIEKIGQNTHWVAQQIARSLGFDKKAVGYCGRKDRHAVTRQWVSIYDPKQLIQPEQIDVEGVTILESARHIRKLRPGDHRSNEFIIRLRNIINTQRQEALDQAEKAMVISAIKERLQKGVPNYFGSQRFGREGNNLRIADDWLAKGKPPTSQERSIVMSAARSYLFNLIISKRVELQNNLESIEGDVLVEGVPTAALWGRGRLSSQGDTLELETTAMDDWQTWCHGLEHCGLKQERRPIVLYPQNYDVVMEDDDLVLHFELGSGAFATSVLAEISALREK
jgi:tRNA pseudouridine13 synthase